jgi:hypothetical protein
MSASSSDVIILIPAKSSGHPRCDDKHDTSQTPAEKYGKLKAEPAEKRWQLDAAWGESGSSHQSLCLLDQCLLL